MPGPTPTYAQFEVPSRIFVRAESSSYSTDARGCLVCPTVVAPCPKCSKNEQCQLQAPACNACPTNYCAPKDNIGKSATPVGGIVGGVIGGLALLAIVAGFFYYFYIYRKKHPVMLEDEDVMMDGIHKTDEGSDYASQIDKGDTTSTTISETNSGGGSATNGIPPPQRRANSNNSANNRRRLSSYESFTRPKTKFSKNGARTTEASQRRARQKKIIEQANNSSASSSGGGGEVYLDRNSSNRNSVATSISTTNASNILPIAYIPGVTVRPTKNNTRSIYSYETDSIFSDLNTIENASIIGDVMRANNNHSAAFMSTGGATNEAGDPKNGTMTAIKAQPRLVSVDKIEEEEEEEDVTEDEYDATEHSAKEDKGEGQDYSFTTSVQNTTGELPKSVANTSSLSNVTTTVIEEDEESDSDVDSDIGEITRATSVRKPKRNSNRVRQDKEILLDIAQEGTLDSQDQIPLNIIALEPLQPPAPSGASRNSTAGSFVLDVEMDDDHNSFKSRKSASRPQSDTSGERSPFEDP